MFKFIKPKNSTELDLVRPNCTDMHTALFVSPDTVVALGQPLFLNFIYEANFSNFWRHVIFRTNHTISQTKLDVNCNIDALRPRLCFLNYTVRRPGPS